MPKLLISQKKLRETIHNYLSSQSDLSSVKMKDLRGHITSITGIAADILKSEDYKPLVEKFAAEFILPSNKKTEGKVVDARSRGSRVSRDNTTAGESDSNLRDKVTRAVPVSSTSTSALPTTPAAPPKGKTTDSAVKRGKFSQEESDIVKSAIDEYCKMKSIEPMEISWYFRASSGVVKKFVTPLKEGSSFIERPTTSSHALELIQDVEEDADGDEKYSKRAHQMLYKTIHTLLPHRTLVAIRQFVNRMLLNENLPKSKFTEAENEKLLELVESGHSYTVVGRALGRRPDDCKQAYIRLQRKTTGAFSLEEDKKLIRLVLQQMQLPELTADFPSTGISWVGIAEAMGKERTQLDYLRRWQVVCSLHKRYNYPYNPAAQAIVEKHQEKVSERLLKKGSDGNSNSTTTKSRKSKEDKSSKSSEVEIVRHSWIQRLRRRVRCMAKMQITRENHEKGINFTSIDQELGYPVSTSSRLWHRSKQDLPVALRNKTLGLQEQLSFLVAVYRHILRVEQRDKTDGDENKDGATSHSHDHGDDDEPDHVQQQLSSDSEWEMDKIYVERQNRRMAKYDQILQNQHEEVEEQLEKVIFARQKAYEKSNAVVHQLYQRMLKRYRDRYENNSFVPDTTVSHGNSGGLYSPPHYSIPSEQTRSAIMKEHFSAIASPEKSPRPRMSKSATAGSSSGLIIRNVDLDVPSEDEPEFPAGSSTKAASARKTKKVVTTTAAKTTKTAATRKKEVAMVVAKPRAKSRNGSDSDSHGSYDSDAPSVGVDDDSSSNSSHNSSSSDSDSDSDSDTSSSSSSSSSSIDSKKNQSQKTNIRSIATAKLASSTSIASAATAKPTKAASATHSSVSAVAAVAATTAVASKQAATKKSVAAPNSVVATGKKTDKVQKQAALASVRPAVSSSSSESSSDSGSSDSDSDSSSSGSSSSSNSSADSAIQRRQKPDSLPVAKSNNANTTSTTSKPVNSVSANAKITKPAVTSTIATRVNKQPPTAVAAATSSASSSASSSSDTFSDTSSSNSNSDNDSDSDSDSSSDSTSSSSSTSSASSSASSSSSDESVSPTAISLQSAAATTTTTRLKTNDGHARRTPGVRETAVALLPPAKRVKVEYAEDLPKLQQTQQGKTQLNNNKRKYPSETRPATTSQLPAASAAAGGPQIKKVKK